MAERSHQNYVDSNWVNPKPTSIDVKNSGLSADLM